MTNLTRDPKGYYIALGLTEDADGDAIKSAFRNKAKRLHPDFNPSPVAAKQFHRLHEAYSTLSDPAKRAAYDKPWRNAAPGAKAKPNSTRRPEPEPSTAQTGAAQNAGPSPKPPPRDAGIEQPAVCQCGKVTAQPRYVIFDQVWGRLNRVQRHGVAGIFCRSCADRAAIRSSLITWLAGWWAWPGGPRATVKALVNNIRGGRMPADRNARLLLRQARAFRGRGEMELARNAVDQALSFATTPALRRDVDQMLASLSAYPARPLKNRWTDAGFAATVQVLPLALMIAALSMTVTMTGLPSFGSAKKSVVALGQFLERPLRFGTKTDEEAKDAAPAAGRVYSIAPETAAIRTGPAASYQAVALLARGTVVLVTETDPGGQWLRVVTPDGASGFVAASALSPNVGLDALRDVGSFAKPAPRATPRN